MGAFPVSSSTTPLHAFLADQCEATKAKYAAEMENANVEWKPALDFRYAESLVHFGLLERNVETLCTPGGRVRGSLCRFRKVPECSTRLCEYSYTQTEVANV